MHDPRQRAAEGIRKLQRVEESSRCYTKAPEDRRDRRIFRRLSVDQDDPGPTCFDPLLFLNMLNMFKIRSRPLFCYPTLGRLRRSLQILPRMYRTVCASSRLFLQKAAYQPKNGIGYSRDQNNPWWNGGISHAHIFLIFMYNLFWNFCFFWKFPSFGGKRLSTNCTEAKMSYYNLISGCTVGICI